MQILKRVGFWLAVTALGCCMLLFALTLGLRLTLSTPSVVKESLKNSGLYELMARQIAEDTKTQILTITVAPTDDPDIDSVVSAIITPELIQRNIDVVIDSVYLWLQGKTVTPQFTIDLTEPKQNIAASLAEKAVTRVQGLPLCTPEEAYAIQDPNPFTLTCQPPVDLTGLQDQYKQEILEHEEFSAITNITAADMTTSQGESIFVGAQKIPKMFQTAQTLVWLFLVLVTVFSIVAIMLHPQTMQAIKIISLSLAFVGIVVIIGGASAGTLLSGLLPPTSAPEAIATQGAFRIALNDIGGALGRSIILVGSLCVIGGGIAFVVVKRMTQNKAAIVPEQSQVPIVTHPVVGTDGRVYFVPEQPSNQPVTPSPQMPTAQPQISQTQPMPPVRQAVQPPAQYIPPPQVHQPPTAEVWHPPRPGEKKWWE